MTTLEIFNQVVEQFNINLQSPYKLERKFCVSKMIEVMFQQGQYTSTQAHNNFIEYVKLVDEKFGGVK